MSDKYEQLKKNLKHLSSTYSPGILVSTLDSTRIAITDLQDEIESLKAITELAVKGWSEFVELLRTDINNWDAALKLKSDTFSEIERLKNG